MPTRSKTRDRTPEIEERIRSLEEQRGRASDAIREAENEASEIKRRQDELAVAVIAEDEEAASEMADLEDALVIASRRAGVARTAVSQLQEQIAQAKEDLADEERRIHRERFEELGRERASLEAELEDLMSTLTSKLEALRDLDQRQRQESYLAGTSDAYSAHVLSHTLTAWLAARLGGHGGFLEVPVIDHYREHTLAEVDPLANGGS